MKKSFNTTIRLSADVKQHLDEMKGSISSNEFIESMLSYFERNGIDPRAVPKGKGGTLVLQGIERIIKILRAIEKEKIDKLLPVPEMRSDENVIRANKKISELKAELEKMKKSGAPDLESRRKLKQVVELLENAFNPKNFKKAERGTDYFVAPVYLDMLLYKVKQICT